ncbi:Blastula protease 10 [Halotydeus destructor]|nr:Blastula protease 10 [Halotydeus destructor]
MIDSSSLSGRQAVNYEQLLWPERVIPVAFHKSVNATKRKLIQSALDYWMDESCIRFRAKEPNDTYFALFRADSAGCTSYVGRQESCYDQGQPVSISAGCETRQVVAHEIGHLVGLYHQHSRPDRDDHVHVNWDHIGKSAREYFHKVNMSDFGIPYDYTSLMQYNSWHFSKDVLNKTTMVTINPIHQRLLGTATELSFRDKLLVHTMYKCNEICENGAIMQCYNGGYLRAVASDSSGQCGCQCPPTATGQFCENALLTSDYYDAIEPLPCGGNVTEETTIETPDFPKRRKGRQSCTWHIQPGSKVHNKCLQESVEIRLHDKFKGDFYCGSDIASGTRITSTNPEAIVIINANDAMIGTGLRFQVSFISKQEANTTKAKSTSPASSGTNGVTTTSSTPSLQNATMVDAANGNRIFLPFDIVINILRAVQTGLRGLSEG